MSKDIPGLYEVFFDINKSLPEVAICEGSGYAVLEGPERRGQRNYYWVERISR